MKNGPQCIHILSSNLQNGQHAQTRVVHYTAIYTILQLMTESDHTFEK